MYIEKRVRADGRDRTLPAHERTTSGDCENEAVPLACDQETDSEIVLDLFENVPCACALLAMDGSLLCANRAFFEMSGVPAVPAAGWRFPNMLSRAGAIFYETQLVPVLLLRGVLNEVALDLLSPSGVTVPVLLNACLRRAPGGAPSGIRVAMFSAKERRLYERELLQSRRGAEQIAEVVRRSSDAILTLSPEGYIQGWNNGAELMFGYAHAEAVGHSFVHLLFADAARTEAEEAIAGLRHGQDVRREITGLHRDGHQIDLSISFTPHMEAPGIFVAFSAIIRDVSLRRLAERALIQSEKLASVGRLASSIAHEINNPLESVTNLLYILQQQVSTAETKEYVKLAQEELARVSQIVTHTLRFHKQSTSRTELEIGALFESVLALYRGRLQNLGVAAKVQRSNAAPLLCYEGELRQILINLVGNAVDAMRSDGGRLILRTRNATRWQDGCKGVRITVADTGTGMDAQTLQHIFEPFFTTKGIGGTGLGLWITQGLVENNSGTIRVRSNAEAGKNGTVFALWFPVSGAGQVN